MRRLLKYMKGYGKECILGPFFKLLEASFELVVPLVMASIIDDGIAAGDSGHILRMCVVLILLAAVGLTASVTAQYFAAKAATGFATKLRYALFEHIEALSFPELDKVGTSTLITRMTSDINQVQNGVNLVLRLFLRSPFVVFGAMVMAFTVNVRAAMVFVVTIPLLSVVVFGVMLATMPLFRKVQQGLDGILGRTRENLAGVRVIRAFNKEQEEQERFSEENAYLTNMQLLVGRISGLTNPLTYVIINASVIAVIWLGAGQVFEGVITQGEVIALVNYMSQILVELVKLANLIINITKSLACANRIADVLEVQPSIVQMERARTGSGMSSGADEEGGVQLGNWFVEERAGQIGEFGEERIGQDAKPVEDGEEQEAVSVADRAGLASESGKNHVGQVSESGEDCAGLGRKSEEDGERPAAESTENGEGTAADSVADHAERDSESGKDPESKQTSRGGRAIGRAGEDGGPEGKRERMRGTPEEAVRFERVSMTYAGASETALRGVDLAVRRGQTVGVIGGTGSGKTTLVHLIPRFYDVSEGAVYVDGRDVREYDPRELRSRIGMVLQRTELFSGSIAENLRWGNPEATDEQLWRAVAIAQAEDVVSRKGGLDCMIEEGGKNLSGGQRQRLAIARALVREPEILILDDSASALDFATDARLRAALRNLEDRTVFIVSQRTSSIRHADQILVLDDGEVVGLGTHEELLGSCRVYREIDESQR